MKILIAVLVILFLILQYQLWFAKGGVIDVIHFKKLVAEQTKQNDDILKRNSILTAGIKSLQKNKDALETRAREELGMIKKGEIYYQVVS